MAKGLRAMLNTASLLRSRVSDAYWERRTGKATVAPERGTRLLARLDQALAERRDMVAGDCSPFITCTDPDCQPYGYHYQQLHGPARAAEQGETDA